RKLIAEEKSLREIRKAREYSQVTLAEILGMGQGDLSKFERRTDAYLNIPDTGPVKISNIGDLDGADEEEEEEEEEKNHAQIATA
ncbi:MAG: helix-turn-helix transcriptional regulator, partial [Candidatus Obscuribacterales bacterium]|nr:helix-turn-helix transcriptional regulator [Candidatus Obscuribacterales bacterium]